MSGEPRRILVAEDDRFLRKAAEMALKRQGYTVLTAADGEEALRAARTELPDLILLDLIMPKLNGFDVLQALKKETPTAHIPVILLTAMGSEEKQLEGLKAGVNDYITKPFTFEILASRIRNLLSQQELLQKRFQKQIEVNPAEVTVTPVDEIFLKQALEIVEVLIRSNGVDVVVVDSVAALVPKAEIEGEMGEAQMGLQARLMSQALRKLTGAVSKSKTCLIFINQLREKIGVMFGNPETTTGGRALKFYASVRMDIRRIASIKDGDVVVGGRTRVKVVKNKVAPPFREAEFDVMYGEGISKSGDLLDLAVEKRIVEKSGAWFAYGGERLGQGRENAKQFLKDNPDVCKAIEERVRRELGMMREPEVVGI